MNYTEEEKEVLDAIKIVRAYIKNNLVFVGEVKLDDMLFNLQEEIIGKAEFRWLVIYGVGLTPSNYQDNAA